VECRLGNVGIAFNPNELPPNDNNRRLMPAGSSAQLGVGLGVALVLALRSPPKQTSPFAMTCRERLPVAEHKSTRKLIIHPTGLLTHRLGRVGLWPISHFPLPTPDPWSLFRDDRRGLLTGAMVEAQEGHGLQKPPSQPTQPTAAGRMGQARLAWVVWPGLAGFLTFVAL